MLIALAVVVVAFVVLHNSRFGRTVYAVGGNEASAGLMGLRVPRSKVERVRHQRALLGPRMRSCSPFIRASGDPLDGIGNELDAIAAVVIGGTLLSGG